MDVCILLKIDMNIGFYIYHDLEVSAYGDDVWLEELYKNPKFRKMMGLQNCQQLPAKFTIKNQDGTMSYVQKDQNRAALCLCLMNHL